MAQGAEDLRLAEEDALAPIALAAQGDPFARRFTSSILRLEGWSVLDAAEAIVAVAMAAGQIRARNAGQPVIVASGRADADRKVRARGRTAFARKLLAADGLAVGVGALVD